MSRTIDSPSGPECDSLSELVIPYKVKTIQKYILPWQGDGSGISIELEVLENIEETIDQVFLILEQMGQEEELDRLCPYFGNLWPAALGLARFMLSLAASEWQGKAVLELGCGLALPSFIASRLGARRILATDFHPEVPRFLGRNLALNPGVQIDYLPLNWQELADLGWEPDHKLLEKFEGFDWILASDLLYEYKHPRALAQVCSKLITTPQTKMLLADPGRSYLSLFQEAMRDLGFGCLLEIVPAAHKEEIFILQLSKNSKQF